MGDRDRAVMPPCGRCRQVLIDYFPAIDVIVGTSGNLQSIPISALLPGAYRRPGLP